MPAAITIVIAVKNGARTADRMLESLRALAGLPIGVIVADGGSTDGTVRLLRDFTTEDCPVPLTWDSRPDAGIADAWNRALAGALGRWVVFAGIDDVVAPGADWLGTIRWLDGLPADCLLAACPVRILSPNGRHLDLLTPRTLDDLLDDPAGNPIPHQGLFHRPEVWDRCGHYDTSYSVASDYEFLLRAALRHIPIAASPAPSPLAMTFGGVSTADPARTLLEFRRARRTHGLSAGGLRWRLAYVAARLRRLTTRLFGSRPVAHCADLLRAALGRPRVWTVE